MINFKYIFIIEILFGKKKSKRETILYDLFLLFLMYFCLNHESKLYFLEYY
jgi:hypothetical protein